MAATCGRQPASHCGGSRPPREARPHEALRQDTSRPAQQHVHALDPPTHADRTSRNPTRTGRRNARPNRRTRDGTLPSQQSDLASLAASRVGQAPPPTRRRRPALLQSCSSFACTSTCTSIKLTRRPDLDQPNLECQASKRGLDRRTNPAAKRASPSTTTHR